MSIQSPVSHPLYSLLPVEIEGFETLAELALNMRWSWNHATDSVWRHLDHELWDITHNPWVVLQTVARDRLESLLADPVFRKNVDDLLKTRRLSLEAPAWFQMQHAQSHLSCVAYFSMEFMLSESLPIYSGGLGNVAGDQLKAASDLGVPVVGIGLLYQRGYFRQVIGKDGEQQALFPYNDPGQLPITPLRQANGEWLRLEVVLPGYKVWLRTWQVEVGRVKLYLLDSNDAANYPEHRSITSELYGGDLELRLKQELLLGLGGWRLLMALGIKPEVCHLNEGHAAFAVLERARSYMQLTGVAFQEALSITRAGNLFTTHTAVAAGFDCFSPALIEQYLASYAEHQLGITLAQLLALGREHPDDANEDFNMAYLAIHGSGAVNAVSQLHGKVSRHLFKGLFSHWPEYEVPVGHVTNGVHMPSWDSVAADELWTEACGKDRWLGSTACLDQDICKITDHRLWQFRIAASKSFVAYVRKQLARQRAVSGLTKAGLADPKQVFDPNVLTLGFARRFAAYKRPNLLLHDPERLLRILTNPQRPVQLILAGKAHPADKAGQALIKQWTQFICQPEVSRHVIFLADYDMHLTSHLVQGVDVWLNTPLRPWEACGTSGMKVLVNGGLNLSELDGWWAEAYSPEVGWALGDGIEHDGDAALDALEADKLYELLEREVIPEFYDRDQNEIPTRWINRMRKSMAQLTPRFSASRAVCEYTEQHYLPAANRYHLRSTANGTEGPKIINWLQSLERNWRTLRFGDFTTEVCQGTGEGKYLFTVQVYFSDFDPGAIRVELYADSRADQVPERIEMGYLGHGNGEELCHVYQVAIAASRPVADYTARVIPFCAEVAIPLESQYILWQR